MTHYHCVWGLSLSAGVEEGQCHASGDGGDGSDECKSVLINIVIREACLVKCYYFMLVRVSVMLVGRKHCYGMRRNRIKCSFLPVFPPSITSYLSGVCW